MRAAALVLALFLASPAAGQDSAESGEMRLYIQQLEAQVRQLTGANEQLTYELNQLRARTGQAGAEPTTQFGAPQADMSSDGAAAPGLPPQDLGVLSAAPGDPLAAPGGPDAGAPIDLSTLIDGDPYAPPADPMLGAPAPQAAIDPQAGEPLPARTAALSGSPRDEYDLAYGYVLTGEYALAEQSFQNWLAAFPNEPQAADARFWLGESHYEQGEYREAATAFFAVYQQAPQSSKGPDSLFKLGVSLAALGEKKAACGTLAEVARKYPQASAAFASRVDDEAERAGCS